MKTYNDITESILQKYKKRVKQKQIKKFAVITSFVCIVLVSLNLFLFLPINYGKNISAYTSDGYFALIQKINNAAIKKRQDSYKNNFQWLVDRFSFVNSNKSDMSGGAPMQDGSIGNYVETSYLQTENTVEGDLLKRTEKYIFYMHTNTQSGEHSLKVYTVNGLNSREIANIPFSLFIPDCFNKNSVLGDKLPELYLDITSEYSHAIIILPDAHDDSNMMSYYSSLSRKMQTKIIILDISDVYNIKTLDVKGVSGSYLCSRLLNSQLFVATTYTPDINCDFASKEEYIPYVTDSNGEKTFCGYNNMQIPEDGYSLASTFLSCFTASDLSLNSSIMLMDYNKEMYMSQNNIYFWRQYNEIYQEKGDIFTSQATQIKRISFSNGFNAECEYIAEGYINDRYALDEYNGVLRVFTTSRRNYYQNSDTSSSKYQTNFFAYDLSGKIIASVYSFAPLNEKVRSVKFNQNKAYVCTAVDFSDPVFEFDLSDLSNIKYVDSGTISGYSVSLRNFTNDTLIGVGYGEDRDFLKIEVYKKSERTNANGDTEEYIESLYKVEYECTLYDTDPKSHFIDEKNGLVGIKVYSILGNEAEYILLKWTGSEFCRISNTKLDYTQDYLGTYYQTQIGLKLARAFTAVVSNEQLDNDIGELAPSAPSAGEDSSSGGSSSGSSSGSVQKNQEYVYIVDETGIKVISFADYVKGNY